MSQFPYAFIRKNICKIEEAVVPIQAKVIQYGLGLFSGIRGHWNEEKQNLYLFRVEDHFERLREGAKIVGMQCEYDYPKFIEIVKELIKKNEVKEDLYIRPTLYAASTKLTPRFDGNEDDLAIYMISLKDYFDTENGLNVCVSTWRRFEDDVLSTKAKLTSAYANSALNKTEAVQNGYDEGIFLNRDGKVCEASGANIFGVKNGIIYTPPLGSNNLNGITRRSVIELAREELGLEVREENFDRSSLYTFDELFFSGTAAKIAWIKSVDKRQIASGERGKVTADLKDLLDQISHGENDKYSKWLTPVY